MIKYIRFNNFYSYLNDTEMSFEVGKQATQSAYDFTLETTQETYRLNKVMAVLGANGSGKTQLLKAIIFLHFFISVSFQGYVRDNTTDIPIEKFFPNTDEKIFIEMGFFVKNNKGIFEEYRYELTTTKNQVIEENLYVKSSSQFSYIFKRLYNEEGWLNYRHKGFISQGMAQPASRNFSFISCADAFENPIAQRIIDALLKNTSNIISTGRAIYTKQQINEISHLFNEKKEYKILAEQLLKKFDTGIKRIEIKPITILTDNTNQAKEVLMPFGVHQMADGTEFELNFFQESNGTQSAYNILGLILPVLHNGGIAVIDELDNDLHPHLFPEILNLFRSSHTNPHNAQLIFTCHTPEVFNILNKHQIYLVEKTDQISESWRLDEMEGVRNDDNLYAKYMAGAFSAVPNV